MFEKKSLSMLFTLTFGVDILINFDYLINFILIVYRENLLLMLSVRVQPWPYQSVLYNSKTDDGIVQRLTLQMCLEKY